MPIFILSFYHADKVTEESLKLEENMPLIILILRIFMLAIPISCDFFFDNAMKPDVKFDDHNDRFNIADIAEEANNYFEGETTRRRAIKRQKSIDDIIKGNVIDKENMIDWILNQLQPIAQHRRSQNNENYEDEKYQESLINFLVQARRSGLLTRKADKDEKGLDMNYFAFHDDKYNENGGNSEDYEKNLDKLRKVDYLDSDSNSSKKNVQVYVDNLHTLHASDLVSRRSKKPSNPTQDFLMHHAVPYKIKVKGFLEAPES